MIVHTTNDLGIPIQQGSADWWMLRLGIPTVSKFSEIMTPAKREYAKAARGYMAELIAEQMLGTPLEWGTTEWTERGHDMEAEARRWYAGERDVEAVQVGFITDDGHSEGGSPDSLVGDDGGLEIKCYGAAHHMRCLLGEEVASPLQVQGYLRITGREWWDVLAYNPKLPKKITRVYRDEPFLKALDSCLKRFKTEMAEAKERLLIMSASGVIEEGALGALLAALL